MTNDWERWEVFVTVEIGRKHSEERVKFDDAATMQYPGTYTPERCAADFLIAMAKEIEQGTLSAHDIAVDQNARAEAAEARVVELEALLSRIRVALDDDLTPIEFELVLENLLKQASSKGKGADA